VTSEMAELQYSSDARSVAFTLDESLYSRDAVFGASYLFVDRCFVFLSRPGDKQVLVRLKSRDAAPTPQALEELAGEFANELLNQVVRQQVGDSTAKLRDYYMAKAFFTSTPSSNIDKLLAELDKEELAEASLEIPTPWKDKRG
jgi:His-Xaa-Ser system protein HxsD